MSAAMAGIPFSASSQPDKIPAEADNKPNYYNKQTRLTIAMWDYSWLNAHHKGGAYENLEQRVAEAAERGFNALRIDCFPSRILEGRSVFKKNRQSNLSLPAWGQCALDHEENVLKKLSALANACRKNNIWLGLDSWEKGHMFNRDNINFLNISNIIQPDEEEKAFSQFGHTWVKALKMMREEGVLERAVWVAPMNEVPHFGSRSVQFFKTIASAKNEGETKLETSNKVNKKYQQINQWMGEPIKAEIGRDKVPLSYSSLGAEQYAERLTNIYDVVDVHFMPGVIMNDVQKTALSKMEKGGAGFHYYENMPDLKAFSALWDNSCRTNYAAMLIRDRNYFSTALSNLTFADGKKLQAIITESYGPCYWPDHKDVNWEWYKRYNGDSMRIVAGMPFTGLSLSNYSEPIFTLWEDVDWHRTANLYALNVL